MHNKQEIERARQETNAVYSAIGRFIVRFSHLEYSIRMIISVSLGLQDEEKVNDAITSPYDFRTLCDVARVLVTEALEDEAEKREAVTFFNECKALNDDRVRIAHGTWGFGGSTRHVSRQKLEARYFFKEVGEINSKADRAKELELKALKYILSSE